MPVGAQSPALAGIAHVAFRVTDVDKSRDFYQKLGFEQAFEFRDAKGKTSVSYIKVNDRQFIELYQRAEPSQAAGFMHLCFEATDLEALGREYQKRGIDAPAPRKARAGNLLFAIHDPEGQLIEYTQYLPGSLHFDDRGKDLGTRRVSEHFVRVTTAVKNVTAEAAFYVGKLAFSEAHRASNVDLRLPGDSGEEVGLGPASPDTKPEILFEVSKLQPAGEDLRKRGLTIRTEGNAISVADPDGNVITFISREDWLRAKP
jgi:catechol 2,3-dioxygenase-like lactoylglutathione lyase family enzyme